MSTEGKCLSCDHFHIKDWHCDVKGAKVSAFDLCNQHRRRTYKYEKCFFCEHFRIGDWHCDVKHSKVGAFDLCEQYDGPHMEA